MKNALSENTASPTDLIRFLNTVYSTFYASGFISIVSFIYLIVAFLFSDSNSLNFIVSEITALFIFATFYYMFISWKHSKTYYYNLFEQFFILPAGAINIFLSFYCLIWNFREINFATMPSLTPLLICLSVFFLSIKRPKEDLNV